MKQPFHHKKIIYLFYLLILFLSSSCQLRHTKIISPTTPTSSPRNEDTSWYDIYFSEPDSPQSQSLRGGPDKHLAEAIRRARVSVDIAALQLDLWSIRDALIDAHRRGLSVRMVIESDYLGQTEIQDLIKAGVPIIGDGRDGLMHNKFVVIDRQEVWTGSMNLTLNGAYRNDNNLIRLRSKRLADNYTTEFEEMFLENRFGEGSPSNTPYPIFSMDGVQIETYFSPEDQTEARLIALIKSAQKNIIFLAYSFTSDPIADAMLNRAAHGVYVAGIFESSQYRSNLGTEFDRLKNAGLDVRLDNNPKNMHHKVIIIDQSIVVTGSYNFSHYAEARNDENTLILHDAGIAQRYIQEFERLFDEAKEP